MVFKNVLMLIGISLQNIIIFMLFIELALSKQTDVCNITLGNGRSDMSFISDMGAGPQVDLRKKLVEGEAFLKSHCPNLATMNTRPVCQVKVNNQNESSSWDSLMHIRSSGSAKKLSSHNAWGSSMAVHSSVKSYTFDNAI